MKKSRLFACCDGDGKVKIFGTKPVRSDAWEDWHNLDYKKIWVLPTPDHPILMGSSEALYSPERQFMYIDKTLFPGLNWEDEPIEIEIKIKSLPKTKKLKTCDTCKFHFESPRCMTGEPCKEWKQKKKIKKN